MHFVSVAFLFMSIFEVMSTVGAEGLGAWHKIEYWRDQNGDMTAIINCTFKLPQSSQNVRICWFWNEELLSCDRNAMSNLMTQIISHREEYEFCPAHTFFNRTSAYITRVMVKKKFSISEDGDMEFQCTKTSIRTDSPSSTAQERTFHLGESHQGNIIHMTQLPQDLCNSQKEPATGITTPTTDSTPTHSKTTDVIMTNSTKPVGTDSTNSTNSAPECLHGPSSGTVPLWGLYVAIIVTSSLQSSL